MFCVNEYVPFVVCTEFNYFHITYNVSSVEDCTES